MRKHPWAKENKSCWTRNTRVCRASINRSLEVELPRTKFMIPGGDFITSEDPEQNAHISCIHISENQSFCLFQKWQSKWCMGYSRVCLIRFVPFCAWPPDCGLILDGIPFSSANKPLMDYSIMSYELAYVPCMNLLTWLWRQLARQGIYIHIYSIYIYYINMVKRKQQARKSLWRIRLLLQKMQQGQRNDSTYLRAHSNGQPMWSGIGQVPMPKSNTSNLW